jgi:succinate dehydrogenase / fumarate reductase, membrane anchor subunit
MGTGSDLGRVRGLGSARTGTHHWVLQRITAVANLVLILWLIASLVTTDVASVANMQRWLASPFAAAPMALLIISAFIHLRLGLTVLIEDYVHSAPLKIASLLALTFFAVGGAGFGLIALAGIAIGAPNA